MHKKMFQSKYLIALFVINILLVYVNAEADPTFKRNAHRFRRQMENFTLTSSLSPATEQDATMTNQASNMTTQDSTMTTTTSSTTTESTDLIGLIGKGIFFIIKLFLLPFILPFEIPIKIASTIFSFITSIL